MLESSQTMNDIPFGDHFTVESRWDFSIMDPGQDGAPRTLVGAYNRQKVPHIYWPLLKFVVEPTAVAKLLCSNVSNRKALIRHGRRAAAGTLAAASRASALCFIHLSICAKTLWLACMSLIVGLLGCG